MMQGRNKFVSAWPAEAKDAVGRFQAKKPTLKENKADRLRQVHLADEAARRDAGSRGDFNLSEILHAASGTVYVQTWKGETQPNPLGALSAQLAGVPAADWPRIVGWLDTCGSTGFTQRILVGRVSSAEAERVKKARLRALQLAGMTVINENAPDGSGLQA